MEAQYLFDLALKPTATECSIFKEKTLASFKEVEDKPIEETNYLLN
jgi:hypothetical protein